MSVRWSYESQQIADEIARRHAAGERLDSLSRRYSGRTLARMVVMMTECDSDARTRLSGLLCHVTGSRLSKANYTLEGMTQAADEHIDRLIKEALSDAKEEPA